jgi:hypothetical protein
MNAEPTNDRRDVVMTADYSGELLYAPAPRFQTRRSARILLSALFTLTE